MKIISYIIFLVIFLQFSAISQGLSKKMVVPEIGKPVPVFQLKNIGNFRKPAITPAELKGRYVIIDFWNKNCVSCVQGFPKLNQVHELYKNKGLDLILVGTDEEGIQSMFENFKKKLELKFPYAFNMPFYENSVPNGAPHLLWVNDKGFVKAITGAGDLTIKNIEAFLDGKDFSFSDRSHSYWAKQDSNAYDITTPFLVNGNGGGAQYDAIFKYRSLITEHIPGTPLKDWPDVHFFRLGNSPPMIRTNDRQLFEACVSLEELYRMAFTGNLQWSYGQNIYNEILPKIVFETNDSAKFKADAATETGFYWYSLVLPARKITPEYLMECMQVDLKRYFGYEAKFQTKRSTYLKIVATEKAKGLETKGGKREAKADRIMYKGSNVPLDNFFQFALGGFNYWETSGTVPVIINETGIKYNVDIDVMINTTDWSDVKKVLSDLGFELEPAEKEFKVLVISAPK